MTACRCFAHHRLPHVVGFLQTVPPAHWTSFVRRLSSSPDGSEEAYNPLMDAQKHVKEPIFKEEELIFRPTSAEVQKSQEVFENGPKHRVRFVKGAYFPEQSPDYNLPEIAMIGRSNVGKSSLIRSLFKNVSQLPVRTSRTAGHTKLLLFYQAGSAFSLVDLPGYGYRQPENFAVTAEGFLRTRRNLQMSFLLIDIVAGFQPMDFTAIQMLEDFSRPYTVVLTKADKAPVRKMVTSIISVRETIHTKTKFCLPQPFIVSATKMKGIPLLQSFIADITRKVKTPNR
ncbi:GTP-binding protein 8-like [Diadema antillarum]|uniref:GTP-binding protein 8-like n=1 Tax=Diadema antillarum TaxID=105358 RepID=UPI003A89EB49